MEWKELEEFKVLNFEFLVQFKTQNSKPKTQNSRLIHKLNTCPFPNLSTAFRTPNSQFPIPNSEFPI